MHFWTRRTLFGIIVVLFLSNFAALSSEVEAADDSEKIEYRNHMNLFGGITQEGGNNGASLGLEYVYRINPLLGVGGFGEYAGGDFDAWFVGIPVTLFLYAGLFFHLAPGAEFEDSETRFLFRSGLGYEFELRPRWSLAPEFNVDLIEGGKTKLVYGVTLGFGF